MTYRHDNGCGYCGGFGLKTGRCPRCGRVDREKKPKPKKERKAPKERPCSTKEES